MQTLYILGFLVVGLTLVVIAAMSPRRSVLSNFELDRRSKTGNESAAAELKREMLFDDIVSIKRVLEALFLVFTVIAAVAAFDSVFGVLAGVGVALLYGRLAHFEPVRTIAMKVYESIEPGLLQFVERYPSLGSLIRTNTTPAAGSQVSSRQELEHLIDQSAGILTADEKKFITNGLHFSEKKVEDIMTPRGVVETIAKDEIIGPLVLDELHKTGHSRFPVVDTDIDHVVGVLHIKDLLRVGAKDSETAEQAMEKRVFYINQEQTLDHALAAFIKIRHHLFVVVNGYRETAGVLTLEDVMEALLGREIVDELDLHDDLRAVAARSAKDNNNPPQAVNV
ncbi:MAG: CBS domain-containing protein [Candidatus Saccharimonas sp.]|nr:CBS domain-containing protein [Candidatus Saccharimonas sp.]